MKKFLKNTAIAVLILAVLAIITPAPVMHAAQAVGAQALLKLRFVNDGVLAQGAGILQTGEPPHNISALIATGTLTEVVPATSGGLQTYLASILVEKSAGGTGVITLKYGTGTNCGTGTTTILGPVTNPQITTLYLGLLAPANTAVCMQTEGASTGARLLYN